MDNKKYLSFEGLDKYDKLIKSYIALSNKSLSDNVEEFKADAANLYQEKGDYLIPSDLEFATDGDIDGLFA